MKLFFATVAGIAALTLGVVACGGNGEEGGDETGAAAETAEAGGGVTVDLSEQNASGQSGTATLTADGESTRVVIELSNPPADPQPAHIHEGTCAELNPTPAYPLENVEGGMSETVVDASLESLEGSAFAVNVHKSEADAATYVACGEISGATASSGGGDDDAGSGGGY